MYINYISTKLIKKEKKRKEKKKKSSPATEECWPQCVRPLKTVATRWASVLWFPGAASPFCSQFEVHSLVSGRGALGKDTGYAR